jgi:pimeloyl-ACP methyl ester carboxylesterase
MSTTPTVVLAHGAWADGSSWAPTISLLHGHGVSMLAAPLPLTSLADDVAALGRTMERIEGPVVLVAHAYAGAVISAVSPTRVSALVFVAALAPDTGETVADVFYRDHRHPDAPVLEPDRHGLIWLPEETFSTAFAPDATGEQQAVLAAAQRPIAARAITAPLPEPAWRHRPSYYLLAEHDRMIPAATQRFMADRMAATIDARPLDHFPLISAPHAVAEIITRAAHDHPD